MILPPATNVHVPAIAPALVPRQMTESEADALAQRLRVTEARYTLRMAELETMRLRGAGLPTVRPGRRR